MTFDGVDWHRSPDDDDLNMGLPEQPFPRYGDHRTAWTPGLGRSLVDVAATLLAVPSWTVGDVAATLVEEAHERGELEGWTVDTVDPHAGDLIDTSAESAPTAEDGPQPWE